MIFTVTSTNRLKVTVTSDNEVRFKVPDSIENLNNVDLMFLLNDVENVILQNDVIRDYKVTLRGDIYRGILRFFHKTRSGRIHIASVNVGDIPQIDLFEKVKNK